MKKTLLAVVVALVMVGTISLAAFAGNGWGQGSNQAGAPKFLNDLNLTSEQQQKLLVIRQDFQKETQSLRFEMQKKQLELRELWSAKSLNQSAIESKEKEVTGLRIQMANKARTMQDRMKKVLTADQLKKLDESGFNCNSGAGGRGPRGGGRMGGGFCGVK